MKRLTERKTVKLTRAIARLAEYEDTGLTPNEIIVMMKDLQEIVEQLEFCNYECEGGNLSMNKAFIRLKELAYHIKTKET